MTIRNPELVGTYGKAWQIKNEGRDNRQDARQACLGSWLVQRPGAHPFWSLWCISVVHLRGIPGAPPAHKKAPDMGHEFLIVALNPEQHPQPDPDAARFHFLTPPDLVWQCAGLRDDQAAEICYLMARNIVVNGFSPDSDYRRYWENSLAITVKHYIEEVHQVKENAE